MTKVWIRQFRTFIKECFWYAYVMLYCSLNILEVVINIPEIVIAEILISEEFFILLCKKWVLNSRHKIEPAYDRDKVRVDSGSISTKPNLSARDFRHFRKLCIRLQTIPRCFNSGSVSVFLLLFFIFDHAFYQIFQI